MFCTEYFAKEIVISSRELLRLCETWGFRGGDYEYGYFVDYLLHHIVC
jgi:hypothetical protein